MGGGGDSGVFPSQILCCSVGTNLNLMTFFLHVPEKIVYRTFQAESAQKDFKLANQ